MGRKHFQDHWKQMVELQRTLEREHAQASPEEMQEEAVAARTPATERLPKPKPKGDRLKDSWREARQFLHRHRYVAISASLCFIGFSLLGILWPERRTDLDLVRVSGQVLVDGQPLTYGIINFVPEDGRASTGILDREGRFTLTCLDGRDGAVRGTHHIEIVPDVVPDEVGIRWPLPKSYADWRTSGCRPQVITESVKGLKIELQGLGTEPDDQTGGDSQEQPSEQPQENEEADPAGPDDGSISRRPPDARSADGPPFTAGHLSAVFSVSPTRAQSSPDQHVDALVVKRHRTVDLGHDQAARMIAAERDFKLRVQMRAGQLVMQIRCEIA